MSPPVEPCRPPAVQAHGHTSAARHATIGSARRGDISSTIPRGALASEATSQILRSVTEETNDAPASDRRAMRDELREARENRSAAVAVAVFTPAHAPAGIAPFTVLGVSYQQALANYITDGLSGTIDGTAYAPGGDGRNLEIP